jgi:GR25 family glycosyltransferase involved in LPS biosynthesis
MQFYVINLSRTTERLYTFKKNNPNFVFNRFNAIDGNLLDRTQLIKENLATEACAQRYTAGALGVAMSHRALWKMCVEQNQDFTILEDDAVLVPNFNDLVLQYSKRNPQCDFIFWGANFDQKLLLELSPGIAAAEIKFNFPGIKTNIDVIKTQNNIIPALFRTYWAVGLVSYTIRPRTAQYLLDVIFPLRDYFTWRDNYGIDNSVIEELQNIGAYVSMPPISLTLNDRYNSTVQQDNYGAEFVHVDKLPG